MKNTISINYDKFFLRIDAPFHSFIWLGKNFIELVITNADHSKIEVVKTFNKTDGNITQAEATEIFQLPEIKQSQKVFVGLESNKYTLVPNDLYDPNDADSYLTTLFELSKTETVCTQKIKSVGCEAIYSLKKGTQDLINKELRNATLFHTPSALLIGYDQLLAPSKSITSFIRLNTQEVFVTIYKDKKLQLHQSYLIANMEDAIFFYLNALRTLGYKQTECSASLHGNHKEIDKFELILKQNIGSIKFITRLPNFAYTEEIFKHASHNFFNLFSLVLCA